MKIHSHEASWVSAPPMTSPTAPPPAAIALHTPSALVRSVCSVNVVVMIDSAAGESSAPPRPCRPRPTISMPERLGQAVEQRRGREQRHAGHEQPLAAEQVAGASAQEQEPAEDQRVRVDHPLQARRREVKPLLDRGERHVDHGGVEHHHELRQAGDHEDQPPVRRAVGRGVGRGRGRAVGGAADEFAAGGGVGHASDSWAAGVLCTVDGSQAWFFHRPSGNLDCAVRLA